MIHASALKQRGPAQQSRAIFTSELPMLLALLLLGGCFAVCGQGLGQPAYWRSCASSPVFQFQSIELLPGTTLPPGGALQLVMSGESKQPVTAGTATVSVYYWGVRVLTASDTLCTAGAQLLSPTLAASQLTTAAQQSSSSSNQKQHRRAGRLRSLHHEQQQQQQQSQSLLTISSSSSDEHYLQAAQSGGLLGDGTTCTMPAGPLQLQHAAQLPAIAPKGSYSMRLQAADAVTGQELMCVDVWFRVSW